MIANPWRDAVRGHDRSDQRAEPLLAALVAGSQQRTAGERAAPVHPRHDAARRPVNLFLPVVELAGQSDVRLVGVAASQGVVPRRHPDAAPAPPPADLQSEGSEAGVTGLRDTETTDRCLQVDSGRGLTALSLAASATAIDVIGISAQ